MSTVTYTPAEISGTLAMPPSKSAAHRAILCAALAKGVSTLCPIDPSQDMFATMEAVQAMGAAVSYEKETRTLTVDGSRTGTVPAGEIHCRESGSTLRFCIPIAAALGMEATFTGSGRLPERPIGCYLDCLPGHGVSCRTEGGLPFSISGKLTPGEFTLPGNISSQFITGLLYALPLLDGDSRLTLSTPLESAGYVDMTLSALHDFGVEVQPIENGWFIPGGQQYRPGQVQVEGDWSQAAFYLAMGALSGGPLTLTGLRKDSVQGDRVCAELFQKFGAEIMWHGESLTVSNPKAKQPFAGLSGQKIDASQAPDLVPVLAAAAACVQGQTRIYNAQRLKLKESDRLAAMTQCLSALGADIRETGDGLLLHGKSMLTGGEAPGFNDHRVLMALSAAALRCEGPVTVTDAESVNKSYPAFYRDYQSIGGNCQCHPLGETI